MKLVKLDRYKVTWWSGGVLNSGMFPTVDQAIHFSSGLGDTFLIMESVHVGDGLYRWKVLPFGAHRVFSLGRTLYDNRVLIFLIILALGLSIAAERDPGIRKLL